MFRLMQSTEVETPLKTAIRLAGGQKQLADVIAAHLGRPFTQQAVSYWVRHNTKIEAEYWPAIEAATESRITRRHLRPDIFPQGEVA